jgi:hypothetical protein
MAARLSATTLLAVALTACSGGAPPPPPLQALPPIRHVFLLLLENQAYEATFGPGSAAPYLAHTLPAQGALLTRYYAIGHASLGNYVALISGQAPNEATQLDCPTFADFKASAAGAAGSCGTLLEGVHGGHGQGSGP